jgi:hypothetical protein
MLELILLGAEIKVGFVDAPLYVHKFSLYI